MKIRIIAYKDTRKNDLIYLTIKLQQFLIELDNWRVLKLDREYREKAADALINDVKNGKGKIFLALDEKEAVGYIAGYIIQKKENIVMRPLKRGYIEQLFIDKKYRNRKIGKLLLHEMEEYLINKKCDNIGLNTMFLNKKAIRFYDHMGYETRSLFLSKALNKKIKK